MVVRFVTQGGAGARAGSFRSSFPSAHRTSLDCGPAIDQNAAFAQWIQHE
jgi:hypothetical protein